MRVLYVTTGRINPDGKLYYPPLVAAQIRSLQPSLTSVEIVVLYSFKPARLLATLNAIRKGAKQADIVHAQYGSFTAFFAWLGKSGKPLVISFGGSDLLGSAVHNMRGRLRNKLTRWAGLFAARRSRSLIVKSPNLLQSLPVSLRTQAHVIPNGVDTDIFHPQDQKTARQNLGWDPERRYIVFTPSRANNVVVKNVTLALAVSEQVRKKMTNAGIEYILDKSPEVVSLMMNAADCLLLTSLHEGSPNVIKEAMACNLPIVSTDVGDVQERLRNVQPSRIVRSWDVETLARLVTELLQDPARSNGAEELHRQKLTKEATAVAILKLYETMASRN